MFLFNFRSVVLIFINAIVAQMIMYYNRKTIISIILEDRERSLRRRQYVEVVMIFSTCQEDFFVSYHLSNASYCLVCLTLI